MSQRVDVSQTQLTDTHSTDSGLRSSSDPSFEAWSASATLDGVPLRAKQRRPAWAWVRDVLETLVLAAMIFLVVNTLTGRYEVQSISMEPTLHEGQYLIVSKFSYWLRSPERGDIVVLEPPDDRSAIPYIKRVVGLPGEHIEVRDGRVWIDGIALNEPYVSGPPLYLEDVILAEDQYLVLGDNRNNSSDSHVWGTLPRGNIMGKTVFRYWPPEKWGFIPHYSFPELEGIP